MEKVASAGEAYLDERSIKPMLAHGPDLDIAIEAAESAFLATVVRGNEVQTAAAAGALYALTLLARNQPTVLFTTHREAPPRVG